MKTKPTMYLKTRYNNRDAHILPACPEADALFELMRRGTLTPQELPLIGRMGFDVEIIGDVKELSLNLKRTNLPHKITPKGIHYTD